MFRRFNRGHSRFDQPDLYDGSYDAGDPQRFNQYAYVQNGPVNFLDPVGVSTLTLRRAQVNLLPRESHGNKSSNQS